MSTTDQQVLFRITYSNISQGAGERPNVFAVAEACQFYSSQLLAQLSKRLVQISNFLSHHELYNMHVVVYAGLFYKQLTEQVTEYSYVGSRDPKKISMAWKN